MAKSFLVQCIPQRGFTERWRSGLLFTAEGSLITEEQMTDAIREDPGLRVIELPEGAVADSLPVRAQPAAGAVTVVQEPGEEGRRRCEYLKLNGEHCRNAALGESQFCRVHTGDGEGGRQGGGGGGAEVTTV